MQLPGYWADNGLAGVNGVVWFRKDIDVPAAMAGAPAKLMMGRIVDMDVVYVNGVQCGTTGYQYPPRRYEVPAGLLKAGKNTITVRVVNNSGRGGFVLDKPYTLTGAGQVIDLKGAWKFKLGFASQPIASTTFFQYKPGGLFNAMIAPLLNYNIKGVIWYQGEADAAKATAYFKLFPAVITDWRQRWQQGNFPFLYVQLANFMEAKTQPAESDWALLRQAQLKALQVPNTAMAVTIDVGEWNDIHPLNKSTVGQRLALAAQHLAYGDKAIVYSGPIYKSAKVQGNKMELSFSNIGTGLDAKGGEELKYFSIAGADKKFVWAKARIINNKVEVWADEVPHPVTVRYAWADNPEGANLYNKEGLPASPFTTEE
jgi:sialate O-acetylesterase